MHWLFIAIGGGLGSVLRFLLQGRIQAWHPGLFPIGTLGINLIASAVIGFLGGCFVPASPAAGPAHLRLFLMVGILGGFSTFSSYSLENLYLIRDGHGRLAALYILASNILGIAFAFAGFGAAKALIRSGAMP
jgi:CrcB protein